LALASSTYAEPCLVEVGLVVAGDDLLDEVAGRGEVAALAEEQRGAVAADGRLAGVEDGVEVAVDPVVVAHHRRRRRRRSTARSGDGKSGGEAKRKEGWRGEVRRNGQAKESVGFAYYYPKKIKRKK
jgi:hypothetical protein